MQNAERRCRLGPLPAADRSAGGTITPSARSEISSMIRCVGDAEADVARADAQDLPPAEPAQRIAPLVRPAASRARDPRSSSAMSALLARRVDDLGPADVVQERGIAHEGVGEELARGEDAEEDLQPHGLGEHLAQVRLRIGQRRGGTAPSCSAPCRGPGGGRARRRRGSPAARRACAVGFPADVPEVDERPRGVGEPRSAEGALAPAPPGRRRRG